MTHLRQQPSCASHRANCALSAAGIEAIEFDAFATGAGNNEARDLIALADTLDAGGLCAIGGASTMGARFGPVEHDTEGGGISRVRMKQNRRGDARTVREKGFHGAYGVRWERVIVVGTAASGGFTVAGALGGDESFVAVVVGGTTGASAEVAVVAAARSAASSRGDGVGAADVWAMPAAALSADFVDTLLAAALLWPTRRLSVMRWLVSDSGGESGTGRVSA